MSKVCMLCSQPITSHIGTDWLHGQRVHGDCVLAVWLTGRLPLQAPDPLKEAR